MDHWETQERARPHPYLHRIEHKEKARHPQCELTRQGAGAPRGPSLVVNRQESSGRLGTPGNDGGHVISGERQQMESFPLLQGSQGNGLQCLLALAREAMGGMGASSF